MKKYIKTSSEFFYKEDAKFIADNFPVFNYTSVNLGYLKDNILHWLIDVVRNELDIPKDKSIEAALAEENDTMAVEDYARAVVRDTFDTLAEECDGDISDNLRAFSILTYGDESTASM